MPRLLLVDDNPSIHRIADSLLAHTDVVLVCASSAPEALDLLSHGERFDVALVDTSMPGMDGWSLLERLRALPETARMPIALMAGVLDPIDPARLGRASIQGFLKKPIELRELAERVLALAATPVAEPAPPAEVPAEPAAETAEPPAAEVPDLEDDLLLLAEEDLWPEEAVGLPEVAPEVVLDLEELDLETLAEELAEPAPAALAVEPEPETPIAELEELDLEVLEGDLAEPAPVAPTTEPEPEIPAADLEELDLEVLEGDLAEPAPVAPAAEPEPEEPIADLDDLMTLVGELEEPAPVVLAAEPAVEPAEAEAPAAAAPEAGSDAAPGQVSAPQGQPAATDAAARAMVQAVLADPELLEALARAVVARLGADALREIAWEIMPDLAGRLQK